MGTLFRLDYFHNETDVPLIILKPTWGSMKSPLEGWGIGWLSCCEGQEEALCERCERTESLCLWWDVGQAALSTQFSEVRIEPGQASPDMDKERQ